MLDVPSPQGVVLNIRPPTLNLKRLSPWALSDVLSGALMLPSRFGFASGYISATFMTKHIKYKRCEPWIIRVRLSIYILPAHIDLR